MQQEFDHLPYPLTPTEQAEEAKEITSEWEAVVDVTSLIYSLEELIQSWKDASRDERKMLAGHIEPGGLPLEYRAGLAQGLDNAANALERILSENTPAARS